MFKKKTYNKSNFDINKFNMNLKIQTRQFRNKYFREFQLIVT